MKIAITGFANSGKTTIFNALTGQRLDTTIYPTSGGEPHLGIVKVPDSRIDTLSRMYKPKKPVYATVEYTDYIGLTKGDLKQNKKVFDLIADADAVLHVVRYFRDDSVMHPMGGIDPLRDVSQFELELIFGDLDLVEKRLEKIEQALKKGQKQDEAERKMLLKCREALESEKPLRDIEFKEEELMAMRHLQFLSLKPEVIVFNIGEEDLNTEAVNKMVSEARGSFKSGKVLSICGKTEMEISELAEDEAKAFLEDLSIDEPALRKLIRVSYDLLGLISFITIGMDEVRAWTIKKGATALRAAGRVHSDMERGFIRAEVVSYDELVASGGFPQARERGLLRLEGKTYVVKDGDVINFRFNV